MIYSSCQYPNSCDCADCEELSYGLIQEIDHPKYKRYNENSRSDMISLASLTRERNKELNDSYLQYGRDRGLDIFLNKNSLVIECDEYTGINYIKEKTKKVFDSNSSPKMFYTPNELHSNESTKQLLYNNINITSPYNNNYEIKVIKIVYIKVKLRNCKHDYVMVKEDQVQQFKDLYLSGDKDYI